MSAPARQRSTARRDVHGIILLDKPAGLSSNQALQRVRGLLRARKAGHTGSLDPTATGLLPLCFGEATKVSAWLLDAGKEYLVRAALGEQRTTGDSEGEIVESAVIPRLDTDSWQEIFDRFIGEIEQIPPMYSALKKDGQRLYELARRGQEVEREPRRVTIQRLQLIACDCHDLVFRVACSKGTYVRSLVEDIATAAGTLAYTRTLRRVAVGPFGASQMVTMETLEQAAPEELDEHLFAADTALAEWPEVRLSDETSRRFLHGQQVAADCSVCAGHLRVYDTEGRFLGVGEIPFPGVVKPRRIFASDRKGA